MIHWRFNDLLKRCREKTGEPLLLTHVADETGLAISTVYLLSINPPKRIAFNTVDALLVFFSKRLGPLSTNDLLEFEQNSNS